LQRAQEPGTVVTLEAAIDLLEEEKKGLDKALEFAEQMNPALAKPRAPTRKALNKFKDEESGEELEFSELSLSEGTSKTTSSCPTYWGIPGKKGNFPKCPYCEMTNHPVTHCQKAYGGEKKPFGEGEKVPLTKPEVAEYYNEAREKWGKKAPEEMKQKFLDWRRSAMSVAIEPWQKKAKLLNSGVKVFVKRGRNYALSAEQRRKAHKNGEHYLED
ncbi:hypothetical protein ADUPG1_004539, partial [Aduncisulcus paluster]